jgi:hypothetical protein
MSMPLNGFLGMIAALLLPALIAWAGSSTPAPQVGDTYESTLTRDSAQKGSNGSSGSRHDNDAILNA